MKLLSYGLDHRMEPRLAFSLNGYAVDVMRASLWMKAERNALDYLTLASSMRLALADWPQTLDLLQSLEDSFKSLDLARLKAFDRPVALAESEIAWFPPIPDPPTLRRFQAFGAEVHHGFSFGNTQTLLGHQQALAFQGLQPVLEMAAVTARPKAGSPTEIAGYCVVNNWLDPDAQAQNDGGKWGLATSLGPYLVTADELENHKLGLGFNLEARLKRNGLRENSGRLKDMRLSFQDMVRLADRTRIQAGDVFCSGSPFKPGQPIETTNQVELEIQALGILSTPPGEASPE